MKRQSPRLTGFVLLAAGIALAAAAPLHAQRFPPPKRPSHVIIGDATVQQDPAKWLSARKQLGSDLPITPDWASKFLDAYKSDPNNLEHLRKLLDQNPGLKDALKDPETLKRLQPLVQEYLKQQMQRDWRIDPDKIDPKKLADTLKDLVTRPKKTEPVVPDPKKEPDPKLVPPDPQVTPMPPVPPPVPPPPPQPKPPEPVNPEDRRTQDFLNWYGRNFGPINESDALRDAVKDLGGLMGRDWSEDASGINGMLSRYENDLKGLGDWAGRNVGPDLSGWSLPDLGGGLDLSLPSSGGGRSGLGGVPSAPSSGLSGDGSWVGLIFVALLAGVGLCAWYFLDRPARRRAQSASTPADGWPVDPDLVSTREELVLAFEHLSVTQCGEEARTQNHRELAERLGDEPGERRAAAEELAGLYEKARYAPLDEDLPEEAYADARQHLRTLAGAAAS